MPIIYFSIFDMIAELPSGIEYINFNLYMQFVADRVLFENKQCSHHLLLQFESYIFLQSFDLSHVRHNIGIRSNLYKKRNIYGNL